MMLVPTFGRRARRALSRNRGHTRAIDNHHSSSSCCKDTHAVKPRWCVHQRWRLSTVAGFDSLLWIKVRFQSGCHRTLKPAWSEKCGPQTGLQCGATGSSSALLLQVQSLKSSRGSDLRLRERGLLRNLAGSPWAAMVFNQLQINYNQHFYRTHIQPYH